MFKTFSGKNCSENKVWMNRRTVKMIFESQKRIFRTFRFTKDYSECYKMHIKRSTAVHTIVLNFEKW